MVLPDLLEPGLRVAFCGTAAGAKSAEVGAYYAGPGNSFWPTLYAIGLTPRLLEPADSEELVRYGIGLTDLCKTASGSDQKVGTDAFELDKLVAKLARFQPTWIAFNGKKAARGALGRPAEYGEQVERLIASRVFVLPSTSSAARGYWDIEPWEQLAQIVK